MNFFDVTMQFHDYLNAVLRFLIAGSTEGRVQTDSSTRTVQSAVDSLTGAGSSVSPNRQVVEAIQYQQQVGADFLIVEIISTLIPIALVVIVGLLLWKRLETRKAIELAMIEKGLDPRGTIPEPDSTRKFRALRFGLLLVGVGLGLCVAMIMWNVFDWAIAYNYRPLVALTSVAFFSGLALTVYHIIATSLEKR